MIVFVHGVPETAQLWDDVREHLNEESLALALPGFGCPRPEGFSATMDAYAAWLTNELEGLGTDTVLVGHDWGALLCYRIVQTRPDLLRAWFADVGSGIHPTQRWHDVARVWQTPGEGEAFFETQRVAPMENRAAALQMVGVPERHAPAMAAAIDDTMAGCILDLYRSAVPNIHSHWGPFLLFERPGLMLVPTEDPFADEPRTRIMAATVGAGVLLLPGLGHWWMCESPLSGAKVISDFVRSLG